MIPTIKAEREREAHFPTYCDLYLQYIIVYIFLYVKINVPSILGYFENRQKTDGQL